MKYVVYLIAVLAAWYLIGSRVDNPARWHVDPLTAAKPRTPNAYRMLPPSEGGKAPVFDMDPVALARAFDAVVMAEPRTKRLDGSPEDGFVTYVQRSKLMRYPDYISVKFLDQGEGRASFAAFSRSRYGYSDRGVNRARLKRWSEALQNR